MKFSKDVAAHFIEFLHLDDKIAFGKTNKRNHKVLIKALKPKFYVGQIVYERGYNGGYNNFYEVQKVCPKTVLIEAVHWLKEKWDYSFRRRPIRCKMQRHVLRKSWRPTRYFWGLACPTRHVFRARDVADKDPYFY